MFLFFFLQDDIPTENAENNKAESMKGKLFYYTVYLAFINCALFIY